MKTLKETSKLLRRALHRLLDRIRRICAFLFPSDEDH